MPVGTTVTFAVHARADEAPPTLPEILEAAATALRERIDPGRIPDQVTIDVNIREARVVFRPAAGPGPQRHRSRAWPVFGAACAYPRSHRHRLRQPADPRVLGIQSVPADGAGQHASH